MKQGQLFLYLLLFLQLDLNSQVTFPEYNLPLLIIQTSHFIPNEPKITATLRIVNNASGINKLDDPSTGYEGIIGIELRGSSSLMFDKKGYGFETRLADGSNNDVSLLGLPKENDWVLHAPYSDKSLMRNKFIYDLSGALMPYAPRARYCEVVLNGDYKGVYVLVEKIKRDKNRLDISKLLPTDNAGDQLTGGYILKIDKAEGASNEWFSSKHLLSAASSKTIDILYHYPKPFEITSAQKNYIQNYFFDFEDALKGQNFADPETGYRKYIDVNSFIDYQLITELSKNPDGYRISTYLYKDRDSIDSKFKMGPVWDYNLALGNVNYCTGGNVEGWVKDFNAICGNDNWLVPFWWNRLWNDPYYRGLLKSRWETLRSGILSDEDIHLGIDSLQNMIGQAASRNFIRWPILQDYVWPNNFVGNSYQSEVNYFQEWIINRLAWMDQEIAKLNLPINPGNDRPAVNLSPNPVTLDQEVRLQYYALENELTFALRVFSNSGQFIMDHIQKNPPIGKNEMIFTATQLGKGNYFLGLWENETLIHSELLGIW